MGFNKTIVFVLMEDVLILNTEMIIFLINGQLYCDAALKYEWMKLHLKRL
jgi:hypothetical protein